MELIRAFAMALSLAVSPSSLAKVSSVPLIEAVAETDPLPYGKKHTDDAAVWLHPTRPEESLILGTSKVEPRGEKTGGLGVYDLRGQEVQFLTGDKLNNVDLITEKGRRHSSGVRSWAVASNRTAKGLDFYSVQGNRPVEKITTITLLDKNDQPLLPYGLCAVQREGNSEIFVTTKMGVVYRYELSQGPLPQVTLKGVVDIAAEVSLDDDLFIKTIVEKSTRAENEMDELEQKLADRFALEGCAYDQTRDALVVGMENLGVWSLPLAPGSGHRTPQLLIRISGSWTDLSQWAQVRESPRLTDDIEGLDIFTYRGRDFLMVSTQGISEVALFDLETLEWQGNIRAQYGDDPVTNTDGVAVLAHPMGRDFPEGVVVLHDDRNNSPGGTPENANYKILSLADILESLGLLQP